MRHARGASVMNRLMAINAVGLTGALMDAHPEACPNLRALAKDGVRLQVEPVLPAVTCPVQATYLTGLTPRGHGIVANGWYFRDLCEVHFWKQSNRLVGGRKIWEEGKSRDPRFTSAQLFWWYNMYSANDVAVTPRPAHGPGGETISLLYTTPPELAGELESELGVFPLFKFWGPAAGAESSEWIARCAEIVFERYSPTLTLVYLPHLDYNLQRRGPSWPGIAADLSLLDSLVGRLASAARSGGARVVVLSEYGITDASGPVHINRALRERGFLKVHRQLDREILDPGASRAFAVADHQAAHVYVRDPEDVAAVKSVLASLDGVAEVLDETGKAAIGLDHPRSGELVAFSAPDRWFTYYFWLDDDKAPPYARTVDIHEKPGYDPVELFLDPQMRLPALRIGARLVARKLGFHADMDVIPLDASLVKGSHGARPAASDRGATIILPRGTRMDSADLVRPTDVRDILLDLIFG